jgi:hypothetical protein
MRRLAILLLFSLSPIVANGNDEALPFKSQAQEKEFVLDYLRRTEAEFLRSIRGLSDAQWKYKPRRDQWSIAELATEAAQFEHATIVFLNVFMERPPATAEQLRKVKELKKVVSELQRDFSDGPPKRKPKTKSLDRNEVEDAFKRERKANIDWLRVKPDDALRSRALSSPMGVLDGYGWVIFLASYADENTKRIEKLKTDPRFPTQ